jgi:hypothetical protein
MPLLKVRDRGYLFSEFITKSVLNSLVSKLLANVQSTGCSAQFFAATAVDKGNWLVLNSIIRTSLVASWSELLTTKHEVPGSFPGSAVGIFPCRGRFQ